MKAIGVFVQLLIIWKYNPFVSGSAIDEPNEKRRELTNTRLRNLETFKIIIEGEGEGDDLVTTDSVESNFEVLFTGQGKGSKTKGRPKGPVASKKTVPDLSDRPSLGPSATFAPSLLGDATPKPLSCKEPKSQGKGMMGAMGSGKGMGMGGKGMMMTGKGSKSKDCTDSPTLTPSPSATISPFPTLQDSIKSMKMCKKGKGKKGGKGIVCDETPSPSPSLLPSVSFAPTKTFQPTTTQSPSNTDVVPTSIPTTTPCVPTTGSCVNTFVDFQDELNGSSNGDTIAVCAGTTVTAAVLEVINDDITICCDGDNCVLESTGDDSILFVAGANPIIQDITFRGGRSETFNGGNVAIQAPGTITILRSSFEDGFTTQTGGNLFIATEGQVVIVDSTIDAGEATVSGAGLSIFNASSITIENTLFTSNTADAGSGEGGGLYVTSSPDLLGRSQSITIKNSAFTSNTASVGGGFTFFDLGPNAVVDIQDTVFTGNAGSNTGGAGALIATLVETDLTLGGVSGSGNTAGNCATIFTFRQGGQELCIPLGQPFP